MGALWGFMKGKSYSDKAIAEYQATHAIVIANLEKENGQLKESITNQHNDQVRVIHDKQIVYRDKIQTLPQRDDTFKNGWVDIHDAAVKLEPPKLTSNSMESSNIPDNAALSVIVSNYSSCHETRQQLINLQKWINESQYNIKQKNKATKK